LDLPGLKVPDLQILSSIVGQAASRDLLDMLIFGQDSKYPRDYRSRYGVLRGVIPEVVDKFMGCGDFAKGFARVRCDECSHEYLLAFSCKGGLVLPVMPSEEGASIRRDACGVDPGGGAASSFHIHDS
jgi:Transposase zinc-binding domain